MRPYTTFDDYTKRMAEWLTRADALLEYDETRDTLTITSRNKEQALTNNEKFHICKYLVMIHHAYKRVHFD
jgi:hypothetical protein